MGSALLNSADTLQFGQAASAPLPPVPETAEDLRREVSQHLAAHRRRRVPVAPAIDPAKNMAPAATRSARIAAAVAERYAQSPSYRAVLAAEAERATQQARAAAEVAARNAHAIAAAQQRLLAAYDEQAGREAQLQQSASIAEAVALELWPEPGPIAPAAAPATPAPAEFTVRLYEDAACSIPARNSFRPAGRASIAADSSPDEAMALDEEIAFRRAPVFEEPAGPPISLPANLIEFPRQLVAARKARPRYAEGPLRDEIDAAPGDGQLRIFEVETAHIATAPEAMAGPGAQWTSIWLDAPDGLARPNAALADEALDVPMQTPLESATLARRATAAAINLAILTAGIALFAGVAVLTIARGGGIAWPAGLPLLAGARQVAAALPGAAGVDATSAGIVIAVAAALLAALYQVLFFVWSTATPGMRAVRIAFCTFADENPSRPALRRRALAALLSLLPLGVGYAWAAFDEQRLTWHDRMTRIYLRRY